LNNHKKVLKKRHRDLPITKFQEKFGTEEACREHLFQKKWPKGFICPRCGHVEYYLVERNNLYQCAKCKKQTSLTAGTLLHRTHLPLTKWFWAIYLISRDKRGCSALTLKNMIQVSYPTAWLLFQKIRSAMAAKERDYILNGIVVIDDAYYGGVIENKKRGRGTEQAKVLVSISLNKMGAPLFAKMKVVEDLKSETVATIVSEMIEKGSVLRSDSYNSLATLKDYVHEIVVASKDKEQAKTILKWANVIISNSKAYILGTYHGLPKKHLGKYLDEFCYRLNRRFCEHLIFGKLLNACVSAPGITYAELTL
jgi:transposase-like protein